MTDPLSTGKCHSNKGWAKYGWKKERKYVTDRQCIEFLQSRAQGKSKQNVSLFKKKTMWVNCYCVTQMNKTVSKLYLPGVIGICVTPYPLTTSVPNASFP